MKTVLILSDFKPSSKKVMSLATSFAKTHDLNVIMLHVLTPEMRKSPVLITSSIRDENAFYFDRVAKKMDAEALKLIKDEESGVDFVEYIIETGSLVESVQKLLDEKVIDLIIMGSHKPHNAMEKAGSSYTGDILQHINCPILVIPEAVEHFNVKNITFATTLKDDQMIAFYLLGQWQKVLDCQVDVLYLNDPAHVFSKEGLRARVDELCAGSGLKIHEIYLSIHSSNPQHQLEEFVGDNHTDMLAMVTHKRNGIMRWVQGSMTETAIQHVKIPVLSFEPAHLES